MLTVNAMISVFNDSNQHCRGGGGKLNARCEECVIFEYFCIPNTFCQDNEEYKSIPATMPEGGFSVADHFNLPANNNTQGMIFCVVGQVKGETAADNAIKGG